MITCSLMGGLGNQLFQIFATVSYSIKSGNQYLFLNTKFTPGCTQRHTYWDTILYKLNSSLYEQHNIPQVTLIEEQGFPFNDFSIELFKNKDTCLHGYFQSEKYFKNNYSQIYHLLDIDNQKEQVIELYKNTNESKTTIKLDNTISIHFRLGDYKKLQHFHPIMQYDYYKNSLLFIQDKDMDITGILFFCEDDDINDVMETINKLKIALPNMHFIRASNLLKDWEQLLLMSCCKHNIIANSSYSWWAHI